MAALQEEAAAAGPLSAATAGRWEAIVLGLEDIEARLGHITAYVECLGSADAANEAYGREEALLAQVAAEAEKAEVDLLAAFKAAGDEEFSAFTGREKLRGAGHRLRRLRRRAQRTMSREQERLAADLAVDGLHAWGRMYNTLSGKLDFEMRWPDGRVERVPMAQWRALMSSADREVGRAAFEGGNREWARVGDVCAAAINAIAGNRLTLNRYRGHDHYLEPALYQSQVEPRDAGGDVRGDPRRRRAAAAHLPGQGRGARARAGIWWFEREAPLPLKDSGDLTWEGGSRMVGRAFRAGLPRPGGLLRAGARESGGSRARSGRASARGPSAPAPS